MGLSLVMQAGIILALLLPLSILGVCIDRYDWGYEEPPPEDHNHVEYPEDC